MVMGSGQLGKFWRRRARERVQAISRSPDICLVRRSVLAGDLAPLCEPSAPFGDLLFHLRHRRGRAGRMRTSECSPNFTPRRMLRCLRRRACYLGSGVVGGTLMSIDDLSRNTADVADSTLERRAAEQRQSAATTARSTDIRLARAAAMGHPREPVAAGQRRALSRSEPVERIQGHGAERRRRAGHPVAPDRRAPVPAPRTAAGRDREPEEPGARR